MKKKNLFYVLFFALILALSCIFVSAEDVETPETEIPAALAEQFGFSE